MPTFKRGDVVRIPFPYVDKWTRKARPALVVSTGSFHSTHGLMWVLMITSAKNQSWPGDISIEDLSTAGLPVPSVIRTAKIATLEISNASRIGEISGILFQNVANEIADVLGRGS